MKALLYTVATNKNGNLIKAIDAEKGNDYYCTVCKSEVILRKSSKSDRGAKRPHFAHRSLSPNCSPETALHYSFKHLLAKNLQDKIRTQKPLIISWNCEYCSDRHFNDILKEIKIVIVEHNMIVCQPDIALLDKDHKVIVVVEVVVNHKPEETVLKFLNENNIILIQINLRSDEDIEKLEYKITNPDNVSTCLNSKCEICGHFQGKTIMTISDGFCWKCSSSMKVAIIDGVIRDGSTLVGPREFSIQEIEFARSCGVIIREHYSKTVEQSYLANTCPNPECGTFVGDHYLFEEYFNSDSPLVLSTQKYEMGFNCLYCSEEEFLRN